MKIPVFGVLNDLWQPFLHRKMLLVEGVNKMVEANHIILEILRKSESRKADDAMIDMGRANANEYLA